MLALMKIVLTSSLLCMSPICLTASGNAPEFALNIYHLDESVSQIKISSLPVISFEGDNVIVESPNLNMTIPVNEINYMEYKDLSGESSIGTIDLVPVSFVGKNILLNFPDGNNEVKIYDIAGREMISVNYHEPGAQVLSLSDLTSGIYVVCINSKVFKIALR